MYEEFRRLIQNRISFTVNKIKKSSIREVSKGTYENVKSGFIRDLRSSIFDEVILYIEYNHDKGQTFYPVNNRQIEDALNLIGNKIEFIVWDIIDIAEIIKIY